MFLPIEIIQVIAAAAPWSYFGLIQSCKAVGVNFPLSEEALMKKFTTQRYGRDGDKLAHQLAWRLPNGFLHCICNDTPTLVFNVEAINELFPHYHTSKIKTAEFGGKYYTMRKCFSVFTGDHLHYYYNKLHRDNAPAIYNKTGIDPIWKEQLEPLFFTHGVCAG